MMATLFRCEIEKHRLCKSRICPAEHAGHNLLLPPITPYTHAEQGNEGIDVKEGSTDTLISGNQVYMQFDVNSGGERGSFLMPFTPCVWLEAHANGLNVCAHRLRASS